MDKGREEVIVECYVVDSSVVAGRILEDEHLRPEFQEIFDKANDITIAKNSTQGNHIFQEQQKSQKERFIILSKAIIKHLLKTSLK